MHCIDPTRTQTPRWCAWALHAAGVAGVATLVGCAQPGAAPAPSAPTPAPAAAPAPAPTPTQGAARPTASSAAPATAAAGAAAKPAPKLQAPGPVRNKDELRRQLAQRLVAANPDQVFSGKVPDPLLAVPVLEVELNADGSVKAVKVLRQPGQARDTVQIATQAIHRAAPYGDVSKLPKPWTVVETFLFNDDRKFKPRSLD